MKIIITEEQLKSLVELSGNFAEETEIIYRDNNIVCLIPKSQMTSKTFGKNTQWCSIHNHLFQYWSRQGLLIRFLFRGGKKIRLTYFFGKYSIERYNWANENGHHVLIGEGNPFNPPIKDEMTTDPREIKTQQDVLNHIEKISQECKNKVLNFIEQHKESYDYCYNSDDEYLTRKEKTEEIKRKEFIAKYDDIIDNIYNIYKNDIKFSPRGIYINDGKIYLSVQCDHREKKIIIKYDFEQTKIDNYEYFDDLESFKNRIIELLEQIKKLIKKRERQLVPV